MCEEVALTGQHRKAYVGADPGQHFQEGAKNPRSLPMLMLLLLMLQPLLLPPLLLSTSLQASK